jgi:hypothetical protein
MTTNDITIGRSGSVPQATGRQTARRAAVIAAASMLAVTATAATIRIVDGDDASPAGIRRSRDTEAITETMVERGWIPRQTLEPRPLTQDQYTELLVERGWIPHQALEPRPLTQDQYTELLVERGWVPHQTLESKQTQDDIVRDLIDRGVVPAATLGG